MRTRMSWPRSDHSSAPRPTGGQTAERRPASIRGPKETKSRVSSEAEPGQKQRTSAEQERRKKDQSLRRTPRLTWLHAIEALRRIAKTPRILRESDPPRECPNNQRTFAPRASGRRWAAIPDFASSFVDAKGSCRSSDWRAWALRQRRTPGRTRTPMLAGNADA